MRALIIAMVLSLVVSGGAFAGEKEDLGIRWDFEEVKVSEDECKGALFEGKILANGKGKFFELLTIAYEEHIFSMMYSPDGMYCHKVELILDTD